MVLPAEPLAAIAGNGSHFCAIKANGGLLCQGTAARGEVGDGTVERRQTAVPVGTATDWKSISATYPTTCGIRGAGDLYCWGSNEDGAIGDGTSWTASPVVVLPLSALQTIRFDRSRMACGCAASSKS